MRTALLTMTLSLLPTLNLVAEESLLPTQIPRSERIGTKEEYIETENKIPRFLLITGCCYSGTEYITKFLQASGIDVEHEYMNSQGCISWLMTARLKSTPWGPLSLNYKFDHIFHQVRNPLKVIQSVLNFCPIDIWPWLCDVIPEIKRSDSLIVRSAKYWYYWNILAESQAEWTYRIEDFDTQYVEMGEKLGLEFNEKTLQSISKNTNKKSKPKELLTWKALEDSLDAELFIKIRDLAIHYGYRPIDE